MLILPYPPRRSHLLGFWIGLYALFLLVLFFISVLVGRSSGLGVILFGLTATFAVGLFWRPLSMLGYRLWNAAAVRLARFGNLYVGALLHFMVLPLMGARYPEFSPSDSGNTMWGRYRTSSLVRNAKTPADTGWTREFINSGERLDRSVWWPVMPILMVLSVFEARKTMAKDLPENNYTLF